MGAKDYQKFQRTEFLVGFSLSSYINHVLSVWFLEFCHSFALLGTGVLFSECRGGTGEMPDIVTDPPFNFSNLLKNSKNCWCHVK